VSVPKVTVRKVHENKHGKGCGYTQYLITLPKDFMRRLKTEGADSLYIVYGDGVLMAFPANKVTEHEIIAFLKARPEIEKLLTKEVV
jgi:hypothetical protein